MGTYRKGLIVVKHLFILGALLPLFAACTTQQELDISPVQRTFTTTENYQVVYARLNKMMRACSWAPIIDGQIYTDLRYGEVTVALPNGMPLDYAKVVPDGAATRVELKSVRKAIVPDVRQKSIAWMEYWAKGGATCNAPIGIGNPPQTK